MVSFPSNCTNLWELFFFWEHDLIMYLFIQYCSKSLLFWIIKITFTHFRKLEEHSSVQSLNCVLSFRPHESQHARPPCPSPTPRVHSDPRPSSQWRHPAISSSVTPFSSCLQSFLTSESFLVSQFFASGGQSIGVSASASVLPMNIQDLFPLG